MCAAPLTAAARPAIVIGLDTMQGLQTARILATRGIPVIALAADPDHPALKTRVCKRVVLCETKEAGLLDTLSELSDDLPHGAVLVPCHDQAVAVLSRQRDELAPGYRLMLAGKAEIELLMDKDRLSEFATAHGFNVPAMRNLNDRDDAVAAASELKFPCVLKPSRRSRSWDENTTAKAFSAETPEELLRLYDRAREWSPVLVVQELIPAGDDALYSCNCYFDRTGRPVASFVARKLRQWPPRLGSSCLGEEVRNDVVRDETLRLFQLLDYRGLGYVEMKHDPRSGEHFLIEANVGRPTGRSAIAEAGGVELLLSMYRDAVEQPLPANLEQHYRGVKWWDMRHDCQSAYIYWRDGELSIRQWLSSLRGKKAHAVFSWSDPAPFLWDIWRALRTVLSRREMRRRRSRFTGPGTNTESTSGADADGRHAK